jgi:hypothetical protein
LLLLLPALLLPPQLLPPQLLPPQLLPLLLPPRPLSRAAAAAPVLEASTQSTPSTLHHVGSYRFTPLSHGTQGVSHCSGPR